MNKTWKKIVKDILKGQGINIEDEGCHEEHPYLCVWIDGYSDVAGFFTVDESFDRVKELIMQIITNEAGQLDFSIYDRDQKEINFDIEINIKLK